MLCERTQVVARGTAGFSESLGERAGGLRPVLTEDVVDLHAQRVRQCTESAGIEDPILVVPLLHAGHRRRGVVRLILWHDTRVAMQTILCKQFFAICLLQSSLGTLARRD